MENGKSNVIVSISAQDIYQHPDNPRKDLGDLSELSDSIAKKGNHAKSDCHSRTLGRR